MGIKPTTLDLPTVHERLTPHLDPDEPNLTLVEFRHDYDLQWRVGLAISALLEAQRGLLTINLATNSIEYISSRRPQPIRSGSSQTITLTQPPTAVVVGEPAVRDYIWQQHSATSGKRTHGMIAEIDAMLQEVAS